jgi:hypothetical protein
MNDPRLAADIQEIKALVRELDRRHQQTELDAQRRMTGVEAGIVEIRSDIAKIAKRDDLDHDEIVRMRTQMTVRPAVAAVASTVISLVAAYLGLRPQQ